MKVWTRNLDNQTPYELWKGRKPDYSYMREIGCRAFILIQNRHNPKLFERSIECVLIGYDLCSKTYWCYDRQRKVVYSSYHVCFIESHEAPPTPAPVLGPAPLPAIPPSSEPATIDNIAHGANLNPILFDSEEEEILPPSLRQPIPDTSNNNEDHLRLTPPQDDPDPLSDHNSTSEDDHTGFTPPEGPDPQSDHGDLNHHQNQIVPDEPRRSNQQRRGPNETSKLEKAVQEVRASAQ